MGAKLSAIPYLLILLPFDLIVASSLLVSETIARALGLFCRSPAEPTAPSGRSASLQILNWNGRELLAECIPAALNAVRRDGRDHEVVVVDNGSRDGSVAFVRETHPEVRIVALDRNYRFTGGNNRGVASSDRDIVVLLNNDMVVDEDFLAPLLDGFDDPSVFAVTSQVFLSDPAARRVETGRTRAIYEGGMFRMWHDDVSGEDPRPTIPVFWAGGGSSAVDRRKFLAMGGLDTLYDPFYVEDVDLSYRAWKRGWKSVLAPRSHVFHHHRATNLPVFGEAFIQETVRRNQFLLVWSRVTDPWALLAHVCSLPLIHGRAMLAGRPTLEVRAYLRAVVGLHLACVRRMSARSGRFVSDAEVIRRSIGVSDDAAPDEMAVPGTKRA